MSEMNMDINVIILHELHPQKYKYSSQNRNPKTKINYCFSNIQSALDIFNK